MAEIAVHEFMTMDGVIEDPAWSFDYPFDPKTVEAINGIMGGASKAILLGRRTYELFAPRGRLLGGGVIGDIAGLPASQLAVLSATSHVGLLDRVDWLQSMILEFVGSPEPRPR